MQNKLKPLTGQRDLLTAICVTGGLLVLAIVVPLFFRQSGTATTQLTADNAEARAALFHIYWYSGETGSETHPLQTERLDAPDEKTAAFCEDVMRELVARIIDDAALEYEAPTGSEYLRVTDAQDEVQLCRMWLQAQGDWQNWLDVCFDAETGAVYYFYLSRECLTNQSRYVYPDDARPTAEYIAERMAEERGWREITTMSSEEEGGLVAVFSGADGVFCYEIFCACYDALIDIHFSLK
ncbi:MAG: hypothetical protein LIO60_03250 [Oscillospiraceae bacterium]|nr:hypothetical protein [Oscillospiraceae bacterium]